MENGTIDVMGIVINYHTEALTIRAVESLISEGVKHVVVVNNGGSFSAPPEVNVLTPSENIGFGRAINLAYRGGTPERLVLLNSDAVLRKGVLDTALSLINNLGYDIVGALEQNEETGTSVDYAGPEYTFLGELVRAALGDSVARALATHRLISHGDRLSGAFMVIKGSSFDTLGGFDERFFMYCEDTDLCRRAIAKKMVTYKLPYEAIVHGNSKSSSEESRNQMIQESVVKFYVKHYGTCGSAIIFLMRVASSLVLSIVALPVFPKLSRRKRMYLADSARAFANVLTAFHRGK